MKRTKKITAKAEPKCEVRYFRKREEAFKEELRHHPGLYVLNCYSLAYGPRPCKLHRMGPDGVCRHLKLGDGMKPNMTTGRYCKAVCEDREMLMDWGYDHTKRMITVADSV